MNKSRLEAFSDGVFSIAITLLVLGIQVPEVKNVSEGEMRRALLSTLPQLVPYVTSFATIGIIWLNHHKMFQPVEQVGHTTLTLNLLVLLIVSFIPFPTAVVSRYGALSSPTFLYGLTLTILGWSFSLLGIHLGKRCMPGHMHRGAHRGLGLARNLVGSVIYPLATLLSLWRPRISVICYFSVALFYFLPIGDGGEYDLTPK